MESMSLNKYIKLIIKNYKIIVYFVVAMTLIAVIVGMFFYTPTYRSSAKLLVKDDLPSSFIIPLGAERRTNYSGSKNPILTQIQIFSSKNMAASVLERIKDDPVLGQYSPEQIIGAIKGSLQIRNLPATDIIEVSVSWSKPDEAQTITQAYIDSFMNYNVKINKKSVAQMKTYIENQLKDSRKELEFLRNKIKEYKKENNSVNIEKEAVSIIEQIASIESLLADIDKELNSEKSKSLELSEKIGLNTEKAINSIALGQNTNLQSLQRDLQEAQQQFASLNVKYTEHNPYIMSLNENIKEIKSQIESQIRATIGKSIEAEDKDNSIITDPVRTGMVNRLILSQTNYRALTAQKISMKKTLNRLMKKQSVIPEMQESLQNLLQTENTLAAVVETLNTKLIESEIRESEIISNLTLIESPSLPSSPTFPTIFHLLIIFSFAGCILGTATVFGLYYIEDTCQSAEEVEEITGVPVLGIIPWLTESSYRAVDASYNSASIISIVYQKIITTLKIKSYKIQAKVIGLSSAEFEKRRSVIAVNIAKSLAKTGKSVLLIDADFRNGSLAKEFNLDTENKRDLSDVLLDICYASGKTDEVNYSEIAGSAIIKNLETKNIFMIPNNNKIENPIEILSLDAFSELINFLKQQFDYIILDTPPFLAVPDSIAMSQHIDALILLCGLKTSRSNLAKIRKLCTENYVNLLGVIARDETTEIELPENQYIKSLSM